jgi:hypothetical protein
MHSLLDVEFKDDLSRYRSGHGAKNTAIARRFALGLVQRQIRRESASWDTAYLLELCSLNER